MPTLIDLMRTYLYGSFDGEGINAWGETLRGIVAAYDELAPDWSRAPQWAQWYAIHASNEGQWYQICPYPGEEGYWMADDGYRRSVSEVDLPLGIDWRLCLWERPDA